MERILFLPNKYCFDIGFVCVFPQNYSICQVGTHYGVINSLYAVTRRYMLILLIMYITYMLVCFCMHLYVLCMSTKFVVYTSWITLLDIININSSFCGVHDLENNIYLILEMYKGSLLARNQYPMFPS